jgi:hypothetical protein
MRLRSLFFSALSIAMVFTVLTALPSRADPNGCATANVQNPHITNSHPGGPGVDATAVWQCIQVPTTIWLTGDGFLYLWVCPNNDGGAKDEAWIGSHCTNKGANYNSFVITVAGKNGSKDRVVPHKTDPAAHGSGWWIACTVWYSEGPGGTSSDHGPTFSNWVQITA